MATKAFISAIILAKDFSEERPFVSVIFRKGGKSKLLSGGLSGNSNYSYGFDVSVLDCTAKRGFWKSDDDEQKEEIKKELETEDLTGLEFYDISVADVTDGNHKAVKFSDDGNPLETFHRADFRTLEEVKSDLKRQCSKNEEKWDWVD